jgi:hypothetical protein
MPEFARIPALWRSAVALMAQYLAPRRRAEPVDSPHALARFIETRASHVAQTALYGYLRTRAGMRFPELFTDDVFVVSINAAKWHVWLACVSDLTVYAGGLLWHRVDQHAGVAATLRRVLEDVLSGAGVPADADDDFPAHAERVRTRLAGCDLATVDDGEGPFTDSPEALVRHAPIIDELKQLDEGIVRNSVRFRWQEVRRELRRLLDARAVAGGG